MMSSTQQRNNFRGRASGRRRGFTLTEMLVVIGIIILVMSIATPMVTRAWRSGDRARMKADINAIAAALEAYHTDHGVYPQVAPTPGNIDKAWNGARMLCRALIGPGPAVRFLSAGVVDERYIPDGKGAEGPDPTAPGPGFRTRGQSGQVYGPYLRPEQFKIADPNPLSPVEYPGQYALLDRYNKPILYYSAVGKPNIRLPKSYVWDRGGTDKPMYNALDNFLPPSQGAMPKEVMAAMMGDLNKNGQIDSAENETPAYEGPYLLWSAGPDELYGPPQGSGAGGRMPMTNVLETRAAVEKSDDITNFRD